MNYNNKKLQNIYAMTLYFHSSFFKNNLHLLIKCSNKLSTSGYGIHFDLAYSLKMRFIIFLCRLLTSAVSSKYDSSNFSIDSHPRSLMNTLPFTTKIRSCRYWSAADHFVFDILRRVQSLVGLSQSEQPTLFSKLYITLPELSPNTSAIFY